MWWMLTILAGCHEGIPTAEGQLRIRADHLVADPLSGLKSGSPLLDASRVCAKVECLADCPVGADAVACFDQQLDGAAHFDDQGCVAFDGPGEVAWRFEPAPCAANDLGYSPVSDVLEFTVVPVDEVAATLPQWLEDLAEDGLTPAEAAFPSDWRNPDGRPFQVWGGATVRFAVALAHPDHEEWVGWAEHGGEIRIESLDGPEVALGEHGAGWVELTVPEGAHAAIVLRGWGQEWTAGEVLGVPAQATTLELVAAYFTDEIGATRPLGARAVLHDLAGNLVYGAPIEWSVTNGALAVSPGDSLPSEDYASLSDDCMRPEEGPRRATLAAALGDLSDAVDLEWTGNTEHEGPPSEHCLGDVEPAGSGCGCRQAPRPVGVALLAMALLTLPRRRHSRT